MGWKIDDIVVPEANKHAKQFECSICFSIWDDPVETVCCENTFCRACIKRCAACPLCRLPLGSPKECSKAVLRLLNSVEVHCPHHLATQRGAAGGAAQACAPNAAQAVGASPSPSKRMKRTKCRIPEPSQSCVWRGSYGDLLSKHLGECPLHPVPCPRDCGQMILRMDLADHERTCSRSFDKCSICGELVKPGQLPAHRREAAELHVQLLEEKLRCERDKADQSAAERTALNDALQTLKSQPKVLQQHVTTITRQRAEDIKAEVRRQMTRKAVWKIQSVRAHRDMTPKGLSLQSPSFNLCGSQFYLLFFPTGTCESSSGCSAIVLNAVSNDYQRALEINFSINGEISKVDNDWEDGMTWTDWPRIADVFRHDCLRIEVEVLGMSELVHTSAPEE